MTPAPASPGSPDTQPSAAPVRPRGRHVGLRTIALISVLLHVAVILTAEPLQSANDRSRWCTVWSLLEQRSFIIDDIRRVPGWDSIDIVRRDGHFYSSKPPFLAVVAAGLTAGLQWATGWQLLAHPAAVTRGCLVILNGLLWASLLWCIICLAERYGRSPWGRLVTVLFVGFGTLLSPFQATLNNHTVAAATMSWLLLAWARWLETPAPDAPPNRAHQPDPPGAIGTAWQALVLGLTVGLTICNELPAWAALPLIGWSMIRRNAWLSCVVLLAGTAIPVAVATALGWFATGELFPTYAQYGTTVYNYVDAGQPSYWLNPQGVDRNLDPPWRYALHCLIGHHGLLSLTPALLLLLFVPWLDLDARVSPALAQDNDGAVDWQNRPLTAGGFEQRLTPEIAAEVQRVTAHRSVRWFTGWLTLIVLAFYLTRTQNYNYGGVSVALRWMLWLVPCWIVTAIPVFDWASERPVTRWLTSGLVGLSVLSAWLPAGRPWQQPWLYHALATHNWMTIPREAIPEVAAWSPRRWTFFPMLPVVTPDQPQATCSWVSTTPTGQQLELSLTLQHRPAAPGLPQLTLQVRAAGEVIVNRRLTIHRERFLSGMKPAECLQWLDPATPAEQQQDLAWLRGLPAAQVYQPGVIRYLKWRGRHDAFECQRVASQVLIEAPAEPAGSAAGPPSAIPPGRYRVDAWWSREVPFGVVQWEQRASDLQTGDVQLQQRWVLATSEPPVAARSPMQAAFDEAVSSGARYTLQDPTSGSVWAVPPKTSEDSDD